VRQKPSAAPPPVFVPNATKTVQKLGNLVDPEDLVGSDGSHSDNEGGCMPRVTCIALLHLSSVACSYAPFLVVAFGGQDLSKVMMQVQRALQLPLPAAHI
jgi:hypothetical protein